MAKFCVLVLIAVFAIIAKQGIEAVECCSAYTDTLGKQHDTFLCTAYCCNDISFGSIIGKIFDSPSGSHDRACCDSILLQESSNQTECLKSWIGEHIWVPSVAGVVVLLIIIAIIACCCSACCRN